MEDLEKKEEQLLDINDKKQAEERIIKVIGVGGGGGNAVNHMYVEMQEEGHEEVSFLLCNTDRQHLNKCDVRNTICIGEKITKGLGAGNKPERASEAAQESIDEIRKALSDGTKMVFITAGMGGGTGTGAAPVIARIAKEMGILTVGIVTIPFLFEGERKILQAIRGVEEMSKSVDAMLVIKNELLRRMYPDFKVSEAFKRADETLTTATRSISELVTTPGIINLDFADVYTTLSNGGVAIISRGFGSGPNSIQEAVEDALRSPLINTANFDKASRVLLHIAYSRESEPDAKVFEDLHNTTSKILGQFDLIWGYGVDDSLGDKVRVTILASGFDVHDATRMVTQEVDRKKIQEYYGDVLESGTAFRTETSVIFSDDELDDDVFISLISEIPTLKRNENLIVKHREEARNKREWERLEEPLLSDGGPLETPSSATESTVKASPAATPPVVDDELIIFGNRN